MKAVTFFVSIEGTAATASRSGAMLLQPLLKPGEEEPGEEEEALDRYWYACEVIRDS